MVDNTCVLVVDDEETVHRLIIEQLEQYSITVVAAKDGLQALRALHERPFDAVITDLSVPYLDGFDLLCQCHLVWPQLPVILMSSSLVDEIVQLAILEGAAAYLPKPVNTKKLIDILRKVIVRPVSPSETTRIHDRPDRSRTTIAKESPLPSLRERSITHAYHWINHDKCVVGRLFSDPDVSPCGDERRRGQHL